MKISVPSFTFIHPQSFLIERKICVYQLASLFRSRALCIMSSKGAFRRRHSSVAENNGSCSAKHSMALVSCEAQLRAETKTRETQSQKGATRGGGGGGGGGERRAAKGRMEKTEGRKRGDVDGAQKREIFNPIGAYI